MGGEILSIGIFLQCALCKIDCNENHGNNRAAAERHFVTHQSDLFDYQLLIDV